MGGFKGEQKEHTNVQGPQGPHGYLFALAPPGISFQDFHPPAPVGLKAPESAAKRAMESGPKKRQVPKWDFKQAMVVGAPCYLRDSGESAL